MPFFRREWLRLASRSSKGTPEKMAFFTGEARRTEVRRRGKSAPQGTLRRRCAAVFLLPNGATTNSVSLSLSYLIILNHNTLFLPDLFFLDTLQNSGFARRQKRNVFAVCLKKHRQAKTPSGVKTRFCEAGLGNALRAKTC